MIKKLKVLLVAVLALSIAAPAYGAEPFDPENLPMTDAQRLIVVSDSGSLQNSSMLAVQPGSVGEGQTRGKWINCTSTADPLCATNDSSKDIISWAVLPFCADTESAVCIEDLSIGTTTAALVPAKFLRSSKDGTQIPSDASKNLIGGGSPALFESELAHAGGSKYYAATVRLTQHFNYSTSKFEVTDLHTAVLPVNLVNYSGNTNSCVFTEGSVCARVQDFAEGTRVSLKFRMPKTVTGWFKGRLKDPIVDVQNYSATLNSISVDAEPVTVPTLALVRNSSDFSAKELMWYNNNGRWGVKNGTATGAEGSQKEIFEYVDYYRGFAKDTAAGVNTSWKMSSLMGGTNQPGCFKDSSKLYGLVTTNALGYDGGSPAFKDGMLDYKVTGLHYMPNGTDLFQGTYDLVMRSETARCLYGFTSAPISASVSVVGGDSQSIATTLVSEKNGWLKMAAYGFTFSEKTLRVKITQPKLKATTITCVKGKTTKKVTAVNAKCPAGFKKK